MNKQGLRKVIRKVRALKKDYQEQIEDYESVRNKLLYSEFLGIGVIKPKIEAWEVLLKIGFTPVKALNIFKRIT